MAGPSVEVHQRSDGKWAWRLVAPNGRIIATDGGQGYENRVDCERIAADVVGGHYDQNPENVDGPEGLR
jgi:uncharacterized protein YegP (UPF0339 family)